MQLHICVLCLSRFVFVISYRDGREKWEVQYILFVVLERKKGSFNVEICWIGKIELWGCNWLFMVV